MQITIGHTADKKPVTLDVPKLIDTRGLIQGTSGSGKSWLLRLIVERLASNLQTAILDPEGEFVTLREKLDMVLVGRSGEVNADPRAAALLARKLKELRVSAVVDLFDLHLADRRNFIRSFCESLLSLPKALWGPSLIAIDEAHKYCPERSSGDAESTTAVIDLCSQGRKRGLCSILVTQRLSKLHKDAAAELGNVFIGRTPLDVDQKRALEILGMPNSERHVLRDLDDGEFLAFGPAINSRGVIRFRSDRVSTTHPKAGERHSLAAPKPSATINRVLSQFADLPQQAAEEIKNLTDAKKRIADLERAVRATTKPVDHKAIDAADARGYQRGKQESAGELKQLRAAIGDREGRLIKIERLAHLNGEAVVVPRNNFTQPLQAVSQHAVAKPIDKPVVKNTTKYTQSDTRAPATGDRPALGNAGDRRMLIALAQNPDGISDSKLSILTGIAKRGGTFRTYLGKLRTAGYATGPKDRIQPTDAGLEVLGDFDPLPVGSALADYWRSELGDSGLRRLLDVLMDAYPAELPRAELAERAGMALEGGTFRTYVGKLKTLELIEGRDGLMASELLFD